MAVKTYKYGCKTQITKHFNVNEFRCKCGKAHNIVLDTSLVDMLEKLFTKLGCSKIIVNSGYRCTSHDKTVGGNGKGQHTLGKAADVVCYDKNGKIIDARIVCCAAQDLNFKGIANISLRYQATHLDVRTSGTYKGNEAVSNNTVCSDFYKYFGIKKSQVEAYSVTDINVGDKVKVKNGAKDYNGRKLASFVYKTVYTVLAVSGERVVIGIDGKVTAAVKNDNLIKQ